MSDKAANEEQDTTPGWKWWLYGSLKKKGSLNENGQLVYTPVDPDLKPVIHMRSNILERKAGLDAGKAEDMFQWPEDQKPGKNFLVNDTFIRVDGVNYVNIRSEMHCTRREGRYNTIEISFGEGISHIITPKCEGYVLTPFPRWMLNSPETDPLAKRCMNAAELLAAEKDHVFLRPISPLYAPWHHRLWIEYYHDTDDWGDSYANQRLQAFNRVLKKKREAENLRRHAAGEPYDYADLINSTYDENKHSMRGNKSGTKQ